MTEDLTTRLQDHNAGRTQSTKAFRPWKIFFSEPFPDRISARKREKFLKTGMGRAMIKRRWNEAAQRNDA